MNFRVIKTPLLWRYDLQFNSKFLWESKIKINHWHGRKISTSTKRLKGFSTLHRENIFHLTMPHFLSTRYHYCSTLVNSLTKDLTVILFSIEKKSREIANCTVRLRNHYGTVQQFTFSGDFFCQIYKNQR